MVPLPLFDLLLSAPARDPFRGPVPLPRSGIGAIDVFERDGELHLLVDLPGVAKDDIEVLVDERRVHVRAERRVGPDPTDRVALTERGYGTIERTVRAGRPLDADRTSASLTDGVLHLTVAYRDASAGGPKRVAISGADERSGPEPSGSEEKAPPAAA